MQEFIEFSILFIVQFFMLLGLLGLIVPVFPGILIMWLAALGYGLVTGFDTLGIVIFVGITLLSIFGTLGDNLIVVLNGHKGGASWRSLLIAMTAGILGSIFFPPFGGIIAAPLAVLLLEYLPTRDWRQAWGALRGLASGWGLGFVARFGVGLLIMILWWLWVLKD